MHRVQREKTSKGLNCRHEKHGKWAFKRRGTAKASRRRGASHRLSGTLSLQWSPHTPPAAGGGGGGEQKKSSNNHVLLFFCHPLCLWIKSHYLLLHPILICISIKSLSPVLLEMNKCIFQHHWICIKANILLSWTSVTFFSKLRWKPTLALYWQMKK